MTSGGEEVEKGWEWEEIPERSARETLSVGAVMGWVGLSLPIELLILMNHIQNSCRVDTIGVGKLAVFSPAHS